MANNILSYKGNSIGKSIKEDNCENEIENIFKSSNDHSCSIIYPKDVKIGKSMDDKSQIKDLTEISADDFILDIGPKSLKEIKTEMKTLNKILIAFSLVFAMSCETESLLTEESISNQTAGAYFSTASGFEDLSKSIYPLLRPIAQLRALTLNGTDIFSRSGGFRNVNTELNVNFDTYGPEFTEGISEVQDFWVYPSCF